jgi:hypothetical protein
MKNLCLQSLLNGKNVTGSLVLYTLNQQYSLKEHKGWKKKKNRTSRLVLFKHKSRKSSVTKQGKICTALLDFLLFLCQYSIVWMVDSCLLSQLN